MFNHEFQMTAPLIINSISIIYEMTAPLIINSISIIYESPRSLS